MYQSISSYIKEVRRTWPVWTLLKCVEQLADLGGHPDDVFDSSGASSSSAPPLDVEACCNALDLWKAARRRLCSVITKVERICLDAPWMLMPNVWLRIEILILCRAVEPFIAPTTANLVHMRRLMELSRPTYHRVAEIVDDAPDPITGQGGSWLPWTAADNASDSILYCRVPPSARKFLMRFAVWRGMYVTAARREATDPEAANGAITSVRRLTTTRTWICLLYTSPSPRDQRGSRMPSSA